MSAKYDIGRKWFGHVALWGKETKVAIPLAAYEEYEAACDRYRVAYDSWFERRRQAAWSGWSHRAAWDMCHLHKTGDKEAIDRTWRTYNETHCKEFKEPPPEAPRLPKGSVFFSCWERQPPPDALEYLLEANKSYERNSDWWEAVR